MKESELHSWLDLSPENLVNLKQTDPPSKTVAIGYMAKKQHKYYV